jgi:hypothetical protein
MSLRVLAMSDAVPMSRIGEYKDHAALLQGLAVQTRYPEGKARLFALADGFDNLRKRVETRKIPVANIA